MSRRERQRRRRSKRPVLRWLLIAIAVCVLGGVAAVGCFAAYVAELAGNVPSIDTMTAREPGAPSVIYAGNGQKLGYMATDVIRQPLAQTEQPALLRDATVAIEDRNFWHHGAVDYEGLVRAAIDDVLHSGSGEQGGSTLTMQLVKNTLPYLERISATRSLKYKIAEAKLATELYQRHSRAWILTQYLNDVEYTTVDGRNAIGVEAASQMLFSEPVSKLDIAQYALLAGLPQAPTSYNPFLYPKAARWRRGLVLAAMVRSHYISKAEAKAANASGLQLKAGTDTYNKVSQGYVFDFAQQQLVTDLNKAGLDGDQIVDRGGLKVYTTINLADQDYAKESIESNMGASYDPDSSLVSINPKNGDILAMQNSTTYGNGPGETTFNDAADAKRQTGSVFKAFVLMTLIHDDDGNPNETYYNSAPLAAGWLPGYPTYSVANASESDAQGVISVTKATTLSINAVYAQLGVDVGVSNFINMANAMGLNDPTILRNPSAAIGGISPGVSSLQVADAYATIADGGVHHPATIISKVVLPGGKVLNFGDPKGTRVFTQGQAYAATQVLKTVIQDGTGYPYANYGCPAAGKTGTTSNYTDAWFSGYNPQIETAVWVGYPKESTEMTDVPGYGPGYGGPLAGPIWRDYMQKASDGYCGDFTAPSTLWSGKPYIGAHSANPPVSTSTYTGASGKHKSKTSTSSTSTTANTTETTAGTGNQGGNAGNGNDGNGNDGNGNDGNGNGSAGGGTLGNAPPASNPSPP